MSLCQAQRWGAQRMRHSQSVFLPSFIQRDYTIDADVIPRFQALAESRDWFII